MSMYYSGLKHAIFLEMIETIRVFIYYCIKNVVSKYILYWVIIKVEYCFEKRKSSYADIG